MAGLREGCRRRWAWARRAPRLRVALALVWLVDLIVRALSCGRRPRHWTVAEVERRGRALHEASWCQQQQQQQQPRHEQRRSELEAEAELFHRAGLGHFLRELPGSDFALVGKYLPLAGIQQKKLCVNALRGRNPAIKDWKLPPVIWIVSLPRTGSTWMHQLCAMDERVRTIKAWELKYPVECTADCGPTKEERQLFAKTAMEKLYNLVPRFKRIHHVRFDDPDECVGAFVDGWSPEHWLWGMLDMPQTRAAYLAGSMRAQYENYRSLLQTVLAADEADPGCPGAERLVLKSPHHIVKLGELAEVFPGSCVIWLHRDLTEVVGSCCSMNQAVLDTLCPWYVDPAKLGDRTLEALAQANAKGLADRQVLERSGKLRFVDVEYTDLKSDPATTLARAMSELGFDMSEDALAQIRAAQAARVAARRTESQSANSHRYELKSFGLDAARVRDTFARSIASYPGT